MNFANKDERHVVWAALCSMVQENHSPQDNLTEEQWVLAEGLYNLLTAELDRELEEKSRT